MPRLDRVLRTIVLVPVFAVGATLVTLLVAWIYLQTDAGQDEIREYAEEQLQAQLGDGTARIGAADFDLSGQLSLSKIAITLDDEPVIEVEDLRVEAELFSFLRGELHVPLIHVVKPRIDATADLGRLAPEAEEGGLTVRLGRLQIDDGSVRTPAATVEQINVIATVDLAATQVALEKASARWVERDRTVSASGTVRQVGGDWVTGDAEVRVAGVVARVHGGLYKPETGGVWVSGGVEGTAADILALGAEWLPPEANDWRGDLDLDATAIRADENAAWEVSAAGGVGTAAVAARGSIDGSDVTGRVRAIGVEPAALYAGEGVPEGDVDLKLAVGDGVATLDARGELAGVEFQRLTARAEGTLDRGSITADMTDARGVIHVEADVRRNAGGAIVIDESHLHGDLAGVISQFIEPRVRALEVDLHAVGPTTDLTVSGDIDVTGFREADTRIARAHVEITVPHVSVEDPERPLAGAFDVTTASDLQFGARTIGELRAKGRFSDTFRHFDVDVTARELEFADVARGDVVVDLTPRAVDIAVGDVWITTDTLTWQGSGGHVTLFSNDRIEIEDIAVESPAGKLAVDGVLDAPRTRRPEGALVVGIEGLDLAAARPTFAKVLGLDQQLAGTVEAKLEVARRGKRFEAAGRADFVGIKWRPEAAAANGFARVQLGEGTVFAELEVRPRDGKGLVRFEAEARAPRDTLDAEAWRRLDFRDIVRSELALEDIDTGVIERFAGDVLPFDGAIEGTVKFPHEGRQAFFIDIEVDGVATPWVEDLGGKFAGEWSDRALSGRVELTHRGDEVITGDAALDRGFEALWRHPLSDFLTARVKADAEIRRFDLNRLERAGLISERLSGQFDADITVTGTVERPRVELSDGRGSSVRAAGIPVPQIEVDAAWEGQLVDGSVKLVQSSGGSIEVAGGYSWEAEQRMSGRIEATSFDLQALRVLAPEDTHPLAGIGGRLDGDVSVKGPVAEPEVRGLVAVHRAELLLEGGARRIDRGELRVRFLGDRANIEQLQAHSGEGTVAATGEVLFEDWEFNLDVTTEEFPVVAGSYVAAVDAKGAFSGRWIEGWWETRAELVEGTVELADTGRELQEIGPLEDVIYVERIGGERTNASETAADAMGFEVEVSTVEPIRVKSEEVDAMVEAHLTLRYRGYLTWLQGVIEVQRGSVTLFDRSYQIARGIVRFYGPTPIDPELDIELRRSFPAALVSIFVDERLSDPRITFQSDPPDYDDTQILQIILGQNPDETSDPNVTPEQQATSAVGSVIAGRVVRDTLKVPVDIVRTHPDGWEVGKFFFDGQVLVGYRQRNSGEGDENTREGTVEWRLRRNVVVEGFYGDNNIGALDILYIIRF